jgi:flagellar biosynthesis/type III secretory pathway protein FliH
MSSDRRWIVRGDSPAALLVPRVDPPPTRDDVEAAYERGLDDGRHAAESERAHAVLALQTAAQAAQRALAEHIERTRATTVSLAVDLATDLARWIVNDAIAADPTVLRRRIEQAVDAIADERTGRADGPSFVVAPCMVDLVKVWLGADATVEGDALLDPGELRIDAGHASLDATYDVALGRARAALVDALQGRAFDHPLDHLDVREPA